MAITELLWPRWKTDYESLSAIQGQQKLIIDTFNSFEGLQYAFLGKIIEDNGAPLESPNSKSVYVLEWDHEDSFKKVLATSATFQSLIKTIGPYMAQKPTPELYIPMRGNLLTALSAPITQIIELSANAHDDEETWKQLLPSIGASTNGVGTPYRAARVVNNESSSVALIGWESWERYRRYGKSSSDQAQQASNDTIQNIVVEFTSTGKA